MSRVVTDTAAPAAAASPQAAVTAPVTPTRPDGLPKLFDAVPFGALPSGACGHEGPSANGGLCFGEGVAAVPAATPAMLTRAPSRCVPMTARRQPGITPD